MKRLSTLLKRRQDLLQQVRLANLAFAYTVLQRFRNCVQRAQLVGRVTLKHASPQADLYWASLTAHDVNASVIEEHFSDDDIMELSDVLAFVTGNDAVEITFDVEDVADLFLLPLRVELESEGVSIDTAGSALEEPRTRE